MVPPVKLPATEQLLSRTALRLRLGALALRFSRLVLWFAAIGAVALLASRLGGLLPGEWFRFEWIAAVPVAGLLVALTMSRRPASVDVAHLVDREAGCKDLFLTTAMIRDNPSAFAPVVCEQAEATAPKIQPSRLVPFRWFPGARNMALALAALAAGIAWLPQLDPLRMQQSRDAQVQQEKKLIESKKITELRAAELKEKGDAMKQQVEQALAKLDKTLKEMKPRETAENAKKLNQEAQAVSDLWKKNTEDLPKIADNLERAAQEFGEREQAQEMKQMLDKLKKGDASALKQALEEAKKKMEQIAAMPEGADKKREAEKLAKELAKMSNQMRDQLGAKGANEALQRALEQLGMAKDKAAAKEALQAAADSLDLSKEELENLAQKFGDANNLEEALQNIAKAKQLNDAGKLDGAQAEGAKTMEDYEKLYKELMAKNGMGQGEGEGEGEGQGKGNGNGKGKSGNNPGIGNGGTVGEDPTAETAMKDEKDKAKMGAGKLLMQWKEEGVGETGQKVADYQEAVRAVKEGVAEAIRNERIPPGYHGAIQKYFDRLPDKAK